MSTATKVALVSCLFDLHKRESKRKAKNLTEYLTHASRFLLKQTTYPVLIYCDPDLVDGIKKHCNPSAKITLVPVRLEDLSPFYKHMDEIQHCISNGGTGPDWSPDKDTALYTIVGWTKLYMVQRAMQLLSSSFSHYCWIDFGINHVAYIHPDENVLQWRFDNKIRLSDDVMQLLCMHPMNKNETVSLPQYLSRRRNKVGGGFWVIPRRLVNVMVEKFNTWAIYLLQDIKMIGLEDEVLGIMGCEQPELFRYHYGCYADILHVDYPRIGHSFNMLKASIQTTPDLLRALDMYQALLKNPLWTSKVLQEIDPIVKERLLKSSYGYVAACC